MQPVVRRMPAKRCALSFSSPRLARTRGCAGQFAHTCGEHNAHPVFSSPRLARTRLFPGASSCRASVFPGRQKAHLLFPAAGRKPAGQKPAPNFHEYAKRGDKRSQAPGKRGDPPGRALRADPAGSSGFFRYVMGACKQISETPRCYAMVATATGWASPLM